MRLLTFFGESGARLNIPSSVFYFHKIQVIQNFFSLECKLEILLVSKDEEWSLSQFLLSH